MVQDKVPFDWLFLHVKMIQSIWAITINNKPPVQAAMVAMKKAEIEQKLKFVRYQH